MTGISSYSHTGKLYFYYKCNNAKKKLCDKKTVRKAYIENLVIDECRKILTDNNIDKIAKEVVALFEKEKDSSTYNRLNKLPKESEKQKLNLIESIKICEIDSVKKALFEEVEKMVNTQSNIENQIGLEQAKQVNITIPQIRFFLKQLQNSDLDDIKYRKTFINIFVSAIYLYDDKITLVLNSSNQPITITDELLSKIEDANGCVFKQPCSTKTI